MAAAPIYAQFNVVFGTNGTGKSTYIGNILKRTTYKNQLVYLEGIDLDGAQFAHIPRGRFGMYRGGKMKIDADKIPFAKFIKGVTKYVRNCIIVIDEAGMYEMTEKGALIQPLVKLLKQRRKYNIEVYFIYHSASEINVRLFKWVNNVLLFHQTDMFNHKGAVIPQIEALNAAKKEIERQYLAGNKYNMKVLKLS